MIEQHTGAILQAVRADNLHRKLAQARYANIWRVQQVMRGYAR
jgi:hypothetical protein